MKKFQRCELSGSGLFRWFCLLVVVVMQAFPDKVYSQAPATLEKERSVKEVLTDLEKKNSVYFFYSDKDVDLMRKVTLNTSELSLSDALELLFRNTNTAYKIDGNQIYLSSKPVTQVAKKEPVVLKKKKITGAVKDENGQPVVGATIIVDGTTAGTASDAGGNFTLDAPEAATLTVTYLGYEPTSVKVDARTNYNVKIQPTEQNLAAVVVVAYGTQRKESVTGAISTIQTKELRKSSAPNLQNALAGRISGLSTVQSSGQPGKDNAAIYLRGLGTMNGSSPLILIDGVPRDNMDVMDPNEIESISVLKDASATAVFGVRGANGAILITTKRGEVGKMQLSATIETSLQSFTRTPSRLNSDEWFRLRNEASFNENGTRPYTNEYIARYTNPKKTALEKYMYPNHYWYGELMHKFAPQVRANVNISGGTDRLQYFINAGYVHQGGQFKIEDGLKNNPQVRLDRYSFRANVDYKMARNLKAYLNLGSYLEKVGMPSALSYGSEDDMMAELFRNLMYTHPYEMGPLTIKAPGSSVPTGEVIKFDNLLRSGYEMVNRSGARSDTRMNFNGTYGMEWDLGFITKGLSLKGMASLDSYSYSALDVHNSVQQYTATIDGDSPVFATNQGKGSTSTQKSTSHNYKVNLQASVNYSRLFGEKHRVGALLLAQRDYWETASPDLPYNVLGFSGRLTYSYDDRYMAEFNYGYNGSEQFAPTNRFGSFPAFSLGWLVSNEKFFEPLQSVISNLKLRASYGKVGNDKQGSTRFLYVDDMYFYDRNSNGSFGEFFLPSLSNGFYISEGKVGNPFVTWETATKQNYGLDIQLFKSLSLSFDYFYELRDNILIARGMVPDLQGVEQGNIPRDNIGKMQNRGFELELIYGKQITEDFFLSARGNFSFNRNKVLNWDEPLLAEDYAHRYRNTGYPLWTEWGYAIDYSNGNGYFNTQEEIDSYVDKNGNQINYDFGHYGLGDFKYVDQNGDGVINPKDLVPIGKTRVPEISYGVSLAANYKAFDFSILFQGVARTSNFYSNEGVFECIYGGMYFDYHKTAWTEERYRSGEKITYPALKQKPGVSQVANSFFIMDRSFLRLKNAEVGFTFPKKWLKTSGISNLRVYLSGQNLFTWDKLPMNTIDPEPYSSSSNLNALMYPIPRLYTFGVNITF